MNCISWTGKDEPAKAVWTDDLNTANTLFAVLQAAGYDVKHTLHSADTCTAQIMAYGAVTQTADLKAAIAFSGSDARVMQGDAPKTQQRHPNAQESLFNPQAQGRKQQNLELSNAVRRVFRHWRTVMDKPTAKLTPDRVRVIANALKKLGFFEEQLIAAINGCAMTPHNMGIRPDGTPGPKYNDIELILRTAANIERFAETAAHPERTRHVIANSAAQQIAAIFNDAATPEDTATMYFEDTSGE